MAAPDEATCPSRIIPAAPPARARLPWIARGARPSRQVFGLTGSRFLNEERTYWAGFPSSCGAQCQNRRSFPITAAGQLRTQPVKGSTGFPFNLPVGVGTADEHKILCWCPACQRAVVAKTRAQTTPSYAAGLRWLVRTFQNVPGPDAGALAPRYGVEPGMTGAHVDRAHHTTWPCLSAVGRTPQEEVASGTVCRGSVTRQCSAPPAPPSRSPRGARQEARIPYCEPSAAPGSATSARDPLRCPSPHRLPVASAD